MADPLSIITAATSAIAAIGPFYQVHHEKIDANFKKFWGLVYKKAQENNIPEEDFQNSMNGIDPTSLKMITEKAAISDNDLVQEKYANLLSNSIAGKSNELDMFLAILNQLSPKEVHLLDLYKKKNGITPIVIPYAYVIVSEQRSDGVTVDKEIYNYLTGDENTLSVSTDTLAVFNERLISLGLFRDRRKNPEIGLQLDLDNNLWKRSGGGKNLKQKYSSLANAATEKIHDSYFVSTPLCDRLLEACN